MIPAPAAADSVFLEKTPAGRGLARVEDRRARAIDRRDIARGQGGDSAQALHEIQGRAFDGKQRPHGAGQPPDHAAALDAITIGQFRQPIEPGLERSGKEWTAGRPASTPGDRATSRAAPCAAAGIIVQEVMSPFWPKILGHAARATRNSRSCRSRSRKP